MDTEERTRLLKNFINPLLKDVIEACEVYHGLGRYMLSTAPDGEVDLELALRMELLGENLRGQNQRLKELVTTLTK